MTAKLVLALAGQQLRLEHHSSKPWARPSSSRATDVQGWQSLQELQGRLDQALDGWSSAAQPLGGAILEVQLGQEHARIGLLPLEGIAHALLTAKEGAGLVHAWVAQRLHLDPVTQVIRWQVVAHGRGALVTCTPAPLLEMLTAFSARAKLRFVSCKPAMTAVLDARDRHAAAKGQPQTLTVVCTEGFDASRRVSPVQCLRFEGRHLTSAWRGWVPGAGPLGKDGPLQGAVRRFQLAAAAPESEPALHWHWPAAPAVHEVG